MYLYLVSCVREDFCINYGKDCDSEVMFSKLKIGKNDTFEKYLNQNQQDVIIDEWDMVIRDESAKENVQKEYIDFLRGMVK